MSVKIMHLRVAKGASVMMSLIYEGELSPQAEVEYGFGVVIPVSKLID